VSCQFGVAVCTRMMVWKAIALSAPVLYLGGLLYQNRRKEGEPPVVWTWLPMLGSAIAFGANPLKFVCSSRDTHGDIFVTHLSGLRMVWIADPRSWPLVFRGVALARGSFGNPIGPGITSTHRTWDCVNPFPVHIRKY